MSTTLEQHDGEPKQEVILKQPEPDFDDLTPKSVEKRIGGVDYVIREALAGVGRKYRNARSAAIKMQDAKVSGIGDMAYADLLLISLCTERKDNQKHPTVSEIEGGWTDAAAQWVVDKIKEISPSLEEKVTVESIDRQIAKLKERRDKLTAVREDNGELGKGSPASGTES